MSTEPPPPLLTDAQRRLAGFALSLLALFGSAALLIAAIAGLGRLIGYFSSAIWPLAIAGLFALILRPTVDWLERRLGLRRLVAVILLYVCFLLVATGSLLLVLPPLVEQAVAFIAYLPTLWDSVATYFQQHYPHWVAMLRDNLQNRGLPNLAAVIATESKTFLAQTLPSVKVAFGGLLDAFAFVTHVVIIPVYLFFFLLMRGEPTGRLGEQLPFVGSSVRGDIVFLTEEFVAIIISFFRGQLLIGFCMGALYATGFTAIGLKFGLAIGFALGLLNIIPYLGTILGLVTALPLAFFQPGGGWALVALVLLVKLIVQAAESWVLTPKIMGDRTGLHPVAIIFAVFFWGTAFHGILGMLLAVPLTAFFVTAWRLAKRKYFRPIDA